MGSELTGVRSARLGVCAVFAAVTIWGFTNTLVKLTSLPPLTFAASRLWLGSALLLAALVVSGRRLSWRIVQLSAPGGLILGVEIAFFFSALKHTSIADVAVISALQPALVLIVAGPLFGERITRGQVGWTAVSLVGIAVVTVGSAGTPAWSLTGDLLAVGSLFAWTAYFLVSKHARASVPTIQYMAVVFPFAAAVVTPLTVLTGQPLLGIDTGDAEYLALFVLGASVGHLLVAWAHPSVDISMLSLLTLAQPVVAGLAALLILGEPLTGIMVIGGIVVIAALAAVVRGSVRIGRAKELETPEPPWV
jgi:drug/metabolite transporter (DMT)-like permease